MLITLEDGSEFQVRSMSRQAMKHQIEMEAQAGKSKSGKGKQQADPEAVTMHMEQTMREIYGDGEPALSRDYYRVWQATLLYSLGAGEDAIKNSSGSGRGGTTRTD